MNADEDLWMTRFSVKLLEKAFAACVVGVIIGS
jgi:hypothetical protein